MKPFLDSDLPTENTTGQKKRILNTVTLFNYSMVARLISISLSIAVLLATPALQAARNQTDLSYPYYSSTAVCSTNTQTSTSGTLKTDAKVFVLGDSLTHGMTTSGNLLSKLNVDGGFTVDTNYTSSGSGATPRITGHSVEATGSISVDGTLPILDEHVDDLKSADAIVIGLGTNRSSGDLTVAIGGLISKLRAAPISSTASIYWINTYYSGGTPYTTVNSQISAAASTNNFKVFDIAAAITADPGLAPDGGDGVNTHYSPTGYKKRSDWIVSQLKSQVGPTVSDSVASSVSGLPNNVDTSGITWGAGVWGSNSTKFVSDNPGPYTREYWALSVLKNIARKANLPENTMVTPAKIIGLIVFARTEGGGVGGHNGSFNPLNRKGDYVDIPGVSQGNASNDSDSTGYRSFDDGVEAITRGLFSTRQTRIGSTLLDPSMTPEQLIKAVVGDWHTENGTPTNDSSKIQNGWAAQFPNDGVWAADSITGWIFDAPAYAHDPTTGIGNHDRHLALKMNVLESVRSDYERSAGVVLDLANHVADTRPAPALVYSTASIAENSVLTTSGCGAAGSTTDSATSTPMALNGSKNPAIRYDYRPNMFYPGCNFDGTQPPEAIRGEQPGVKEVQRLVDSKWGGGSGNIFNCREMTGNPGVPSLHGTGRAVDSMHDVGNAAELANGNKTMGWLVANAASIGVQYVKYWRVQWTPNKGFFCVSDHEDQGVHSTHVHWELNWDGALKKTPHFNGQPAGSSMIEINQNLCPVV